MLTATSGIKETVTQSFKLAGCPHAVALLSEIVRKMTAFNIKFILAWSCISAFCLGTGVAYTPATSSSFLTPCVPGLPGRDGRDGQQGPPGSSGQPGPPGPQGQQGPQGAQGPVGRDGRDGADGSPGADGIHGPHGPPGPAGSDGTDGVPGQPGTNGTAGPPGPPGPPSTVSDAVIEQMMREILEDVRRELNLICNGDSEKYPAASCKEVYDCNSTAPSGNYWIRNSTGGILQVYCLMETPNCGDTRGGWMRAAYINMRGGATTCPEGLTTYTPSSKRLCSSSLPSGGCSSVIYPVYGVPITKVCGRALGYQHRDTDAFNSAALPIDSDYTDGLSVTHGTPRNHIWTFTAGQSKDYYYPEDNCPCAPTPGSAPPSFVGDNYFCESGNTGPFETQWYLDDPLWDSQGCASGSSCCDRGGPWFTTTLYQEVRDDIEVRWCKSGIGEDVGVEVLEIYVY